MKSKSDELRATITSTIYAEINKFQFRKQSTYFTRKFGDLIQAIDIQRGSRSTTDRLIVTCNVGVYLTCLYKMEPMFHPKFGGVGSCQLRGRIGGFFDDPGDHWWTVSSDDDARSCGREIVTVLIQRVLPLLDDLTTCKDVLLYLTEPRIYYPVAVIGIDHVVAGLRKYIKSIDGETLPDVTPFKAPPSSVIGDETQTLWPLGTLEKLPDGTFKLIPNPNFKQNE